jgi:hypothetical protein
MPESRAMWRWTRFAYVMLWIIAFAAVGLVFLAPFTPAQPQTHQNDGWQPLRPGRVTVSTGEPLMKHNKGVGQWSVYFVKFTLTVMNESDIHRHVVLVVCRYTISNDPREIQRMPNREVKDIKPGAIIEEEIEFADRMPVTGVWCYNGQMVPDTVGNYVRAQR